MLFLAIISLFYLQSLISSTLKPASSIYRILSYAAMLAWGVFALVATRNQIKEWLYALWPALICLTVAAALYFTKSGDNYLETRTKNILFFVFFAFIFLYYSRNGYEKHRTIIIALWMLEILISCIHSLIFLQKYPDYARALATPDMYGAYEGLQTYTMISFDHACCLSFLTPALLYKALDKKMNWYERLLLLLCCLLFWFTILKTQFAISLVLASLGIFIVLIVVLLEKMDNRVKIWICALLIFLLALLIFFLPTILIALYDSNSLGTILSERIYSIYRMLAGLDIGNSDLQDRLYHYSLTLEGIRDSKFLGGYFTGSATCGGHSEFGDMIALFGVFFFAIFIWFIVNMFRSGYKYTDKEMHPAFIVSYAIYFIFSLINTSLWTSIGIGLFIILPFVLSAYDSAILSLRSTK